VAGGVDLHHEHQQQQRRSCARPAEPEQQRQSDPRRQGEGEARSRSEVVEQESPTDRSCEDRARQQGTPHCVEALRFRDPIHPRRGQDCDSGECGRQVELGGSKAVQPRQPVLQQPVESRLLAHGQLQQKGSGQQMAEQRRPRARHQRRHRQGGNEHAAQARNRHRIALRGGKEQAAVEPGGRRRGHHGDPLGPNRLSHQLEQRQQLHGRQPQDHRRGHSSRLHVGPQPQRSPHELRVQTPNCNVDGHVQDDAVCRLGIARHER